MKKASLFSGLLEIYRRIPLTRELALDEAEEHVRTPLPASATHPFTLEAAAERARLVRPLGGSGASPVGRSLASVGERVAPAATTGDPQGARGVGGKGQPRATTTSGEDDSPRGKKRKGSCTPADSVFLRKYGGKSLANSILDPEMDFFLASSPGFKGLKGNLPKTFWELLKSSVAKKTWEKYSSAWKKWGQFKIDSGLEEGKKFSPELGLAFTCWCKSHTDLKVSTVNQYLGALGKLSLLTQTLERKEAKGSERESGKTSLQKILLKGFKNLESRDLSIKKITAMDLQTLSWIRKGLLTGIWRKVTRTSVWSACLLAFWGSFRL